MPRQSPCPECWQAIEFPDSLSGQQINCPHCNQLVTLPEAVAENDSCATGVADDSWKVVQAHSHEPLSEKSEPTMEVAEQNTLPLKCEEIYYSDPKNSKDSKNHT